MLKIQLCTFAKDRCEMRSKEHTRDIIYVAANSCHPSNRFLSSHQTNSNTNRSRWHNLSPGFSLPAVTRPQAPTYSHHIRHTHTRTDTRSFVCLMWDLLAPNSSFIILFVHIYKLEKRNNINKYKEKRFNENLKRQKCLSINWRQWTKRNQWTIKEQKQCAIKTI